MSAQEVALEAFLRDRDAWRKLAYQAIDEARQLREKREEAEALAIELLGAWLRYHYAPKLAEPAGFRIDLLRWVCNEQLDWCDIAARLLDSLKVNWVRDGVPVTVIAAQGVRKGVLRGNTITVEGDADTEAECDADTEAEGEAE